MRRKEMTSLIVAVAAAGMLAGCGGTGNPTENTSAGEQTENEKTEENIQENVDAASDETEDTDSTDSTSEVPAVYMTTDISSEGIIAVYEALQASPEGNIAVKLSTGEPGSNYLRTDLIGDLVQSFDNPTILWSAIRHTAVPVPILPCIIRWRKTTATRGSRMWTSWMRTDP